MAHKTLINGTKYDVSGGICKVSGTGYNVKGGKTLVGGTLRNITFDVTWAKYNCTKGNTYAEATPSSGTTQKTYSTGATVSACSSYSFSETQGYTGNATAYSVGNSSLEGKYIVSPTSVLLITNWGYTMSNNVINGYVLTRREVAAAEVVDTFYTKGDTLYNEISAEYGQLPENGTLISGSAEDDYCVIQINGTNYYYEKI